MFFRQEGFFMKRHILFDAIKDGVSIMTCTWPKRYFYIKNGKKEGWCNVLAVFTKMDDGTEYIVVRYSIARTKKIHKDEFEIPGERMEYGQRDRAKHLRRLAIIKKFANGYKVVQDDLLYVSACNGGIAIGCKANGDMILLNERGDIVCGLGKRRNLMKVVDPKTGKTYRQLAKKYAVAKKKNPKN